MRSFGCAMSGWMRFGGRFALAAILLIALGGDQLVKERSRETATAAQRDLPERDETRVPTSDGDRGTGLSEVADPCAGDPSCYQRRDLEAQESMADAALGMTKATWVQVWVTIIGTVLVLFSLKFSRDAVRLSREAIVSNERAWLKIEEPRIVSPLTWKQEEDGSDQIGSIGIDVCVRNIGKTPALNALVSCLVVRGSLIGGAQAYADVAFRERSKPPPDGWGVTVFPDDHFSERLTVAINKGNVSSRESFSHMLLVVCVTYRLVSGDLRQSGFACPIVSPVEDGSFQRIGPGIGDTPADRLCFWRGVSDDSFVS